MIDSTHHIELDGVKYRLAEGEQGDHYDKRGETLRPPNAVTVQGLDTQKFQPRPDTLLWTWTDWSEGEGRLTWKFGEAGRSYEITSARAFEEPGHLLPGYDVASTQYLGSALAKSLQLVAGLGNMYGLDTNSLTWYLFNSDGDISTSNTYTGPTSAPQMYTVCGDEDAIYWVEYNTDNVYKWTGGAAATTISTSSKFTGGSNRYMAQLGSYVYAYEPTSAKVWEIAKSGAAETTIDDWDEAGSSGYITTLDGKVYVAVVVEGRTVIREISPTSAAATGYGAEVCRIEGFVAQGMWSHTGSIYLVGTTEEPTTSFTVMYYTPNSQQSQYGTLGPVRPGTNLGNAYAGVSGRLLDHFFVARGDTSSDDAYLFQIDAVTGGLACLARWDASDEAFGSVATWKGNVLMSTVSGATTKRTYVARHDRMSRSAVYAYSPEHDFDALITKYLGTLKIVTEPLPADWTVTVAAQFDNDTTWQILLTHDTTNATETEVVCSTSATTTYEFNVMKLRIYMEYAGLSATTTGPVVLGVEARAGVATKVPVWKMVIDLNDGASAADPKDGYTKTQALLASCDKTTVLSLKDGYISHEPGVYDSVDVTVDAYDIPLDRPGEGYGVITLRGVV